MSDVAQRQEVKTWDDRPAPPMSETAQVLSMIERAASDPRVDLPKLETLMKMRDKVRAEAARTAFNEAMARVQSEIPQVVRKAENTHTRSYYATLEAIGEQIDPIITKAGFSQSFGMAECPVPAHYRITCRTSLGSHEQLDSADIPIDAAGAQGKVNKTATQAFGSTISYGRRYLTMMIFNVKSKKVMRDIDGNSEESSEPIESEQFGVIRKLMAEAGTDEEKFCAVFKISALAELPASKFEKAVAELKAAIEWQRKAKKGAAS